MSFHCSAHIGRLALSVGCLALGAGALKADITYGTFDVANCLPFMCNSVIGGQSIDYQQVYTAAGFAGPTTITAVDWYWDAATGIGDTVLGGSYFFYWGYAALGSVDNLSSTLANNYTSARNLLGSAFVPPGGFAYGAVLSMNGINFTYDPSLGDLLFEVVVDNQDGVSNGSNGYNQADDTGTVTSRAYCITDTGCFADDTGLVTTFETGTPEPSTLGMLGGALLGLSLLRRQFFKA
jgi:hypothetical protein